MKLSDLTDQMWFDRLSARRNANIIPVRQWMSRYDGNQPMYFVARLLADQDDRFPALTINWDRKFIDTIDGLCMTEGFQVNGADDFDEKMWAAWTRNDMPEFESENNIFTTTTGYGYVAVGPSDEGALITVESPEQVAIEIDPRTRRTVASLLYYKSDQEATTDDRAVLQVADDRGARLIEFEDGKPISGGKPQKWMAQPSKLQSSPEVPMVRYLNRQRQRVPQSELIPLSPIVDATNLIATHMLATSHHHAMPRMLAIDVAESLFFNKDGTVNREAVKNATGSMWIVPAEAGEDGKTLPKEQQGPTPDIKQLPAADMRNFHDSISLLGRIGSGLCDMSPSAFGFGVADNPESEGSQVVRNQSLATRLKRIHTSRGASHARVVRLASAVEGRDVSALKSIETRWMDPSKLSKPVLAKAVNETLASGISDLHQARVDYGYSPAVIKAMENRERIALRDPFRVPSESDETEPDDGAADTPPSGS